MGHRLGNRWLRAARSSPSPTAVSATMSPCCARQFAEDLLEHLRVHNWTFDPVPQKPEPGDLRQVWLPNGQHIAMLHQLSYTYSQTKFGGENQEILRALGRRRGLDVPRHLPRRQPARRQRERDSWATPTSSRRRTPAPRTLGFQLAWLTTDGDRDARLAAAAEAEGLTVSPTMDPTLERDELERPRRAVAGQVAERVTTSTRRPMPSRRSSTTSCCADGS